MRFQPTVAFVDAEQVSGTITQHKALRDWIDGGPYIPPMTPGVGVVPIIVETPEGDREANPGDWIVRARNGDFSVLTDAAFRFHYEVADGDTDR